MASGTVEDGYWLDGKFVETFAEQERRQRIFNACLLDKSSDVDMQISSIEMAVQTTCGSVAKDPS